MQSLKDIKNTLSKGSPNNNTIGKQNWNEAVDSILESSTFVFTTKANITSSITHFEPLEIPAGTHITSIQSMVTKEFTLPSPAQGTEVAATLRLSLGEPITEKANADDYWGEHLVIQLQNGVIDSGSVGYGNSEFNIFKSFVSTKNTNYSTSISGSIIAEPNSCRLPSGVVTFKQGVPIMVSNPIRSVANFYEFNYYGTLGDETSADWLPTNYGVWYINQLIKSLDGNANSILCIRQSTSPPARYEFFDYQNLPANTHAHFTNNYLIPIKEGQKEYIHENTKLYATLYLHGGEASTPPYGDTPVTDPATYFGYNESLSPTNNDGEVALSIIVTQH